MPLLILMLLLRHILPLLRHAVYYACRRFSPCCYYAMLLFFAAYVWYWYYAAAYDIFICCCHYADTPLICYYCYFHFSYFRCWFHCRHFSLPPYEAAALFSLLDMRADADIAAPAMLFFAAFATIIAITSLYTFSLRHIFRYFSLLLLFTFFATLPYCFHFRCWYILRRFSPHATLALFHYAYAADTDTLIFAIAAAYYSPLFATTRIQSLPLRRFIISLLLRFDACCFAIFIALLITLAAIFFRCCCRFRCHDAIRYLLLMPFFITTPLRHY